ncbi:Uncharacterised protein [uncultured archaeon]|nr:Uncharacterised protein [uncultured archaeon]
MFYAMIKRRSWNFTALSILAYAALILGSNMETLLVFCLSLFLGIIGVMHLLKPTKEGEELNLRMAAFIGGMLLVQILYALYHTEAINIDLLKNMIKSVALPAAAFAGPVLFGLVIDRVKYKGADRGRTGLPMAGALVLVALAMFHLAGTLAILPILLMVLLFNPASNWVRAQPNHARLEMCILLLGAIVLIGTVAPDLPVSSDMFDSYRFFGSYSNALTRTISEQGAGASSFDGYFGASGLSLGAPPSSEKLGEVIATAVDQMVKSAVGIKPFELAMSVVSVINIIPTMLLNLFYNAAAAFMNVYLEKDGVQADFLVAKDAAGNIDLFGGRVNSLASMILFLGPALLLLALARAWKRGSELPTGALLLLCFIVPVTFMGFMKVKMLIFLAVAFVFSLGAAWAEGERLFMEFMARRAEKKSEKTHAAAGEWFSAWPAHPRHIAWMLVALAVLLQLGWPTYLVFDSNPGIDPGYTQTYAIGAAILAHSATPTMQENPAAGFKALNLSCIAYNVPAACEAVNNQNATLNEPLRFYNSDLCYFSLVGNQSAKLTQSTRVSAGYRCGYYPYQWLNMYEWMNANINHSERITSWWDYGHWTNFFGRANTVLRPEHASTEMIGRVAYAYTHQSPLELRRVMKDYGSRYALMDSEIVGSAQSNMFIFGGKFSALNYLGCDWANRTNVQNQPGSSMCELENQPEQLLIPQRANEVSPCLISESTQEKGQIGYRMSFVAETGGIRRDAKAMYCVRQEQTADGQSMGVYFLDQKDDSGNLMRSPAIWLAQSADANYLAYAAVYTKDPWATINGTPVSRWDYRFGPYYDNSLYQGFILGQLEGFDLVYDYPQGLGGKIRIFRMKDEYYNKKE